MLAKQLTFRTIAIGDNPSSLIGLLAPNGAIPSIFLASLLLMSGPVARAAEEDYYRLVRFPISERIVLEAGALEFLPDGRLAIAPRRGEIYLLDKPLTDRPEE